MKKLPLKLLFFCFVVSSLSAQQKINTTGELLHGLNKLKVLGAAMYVAAHPDDENTLLITWLANEKKVRTAYTAMTRGDGGQNLLGSEKGENAGLLRTNELLGARRIDGGEQYFTRANDFGYTKTTEEALGTWGKDQILSDLVYRIRKFQPDVIITRFPPDSRAGHGHHSASSLLAEEAFDAAADKNMFPEQLDEVAIWQAKRLVWNFYNRGFQNTPPEDSLEFIQVDIGGFNPLLGESYGEIGSRARSMHKSQGFGAYLRRGERIETLRHTKGEPAQNDLFDGINTSWSRIKGGGIITSLINEVIRNFRPEFPSASIPTMNQIYKLMETLPDSPLLQYKKEQLADLIMQFSGIYLEINSQDYSYSALDSLKGFVRIINRSDLKVNLQKIQLTNLNFEWSENRILENNKQQEISFAAFIPNGFPLTQPYWLQKNHPKGFYVVDDPKLRGQALSNPAVEAIVEINIEGLILKRNVPINYKYVEPSYGEIYRPLEIRPALSLSPNTNSLVFNQNTAQEILISLKSGKNNIKGRLNLEVPEGWQYSPMSPTFSLAKKNDEIILKFNITPPKTASKSKIRISASVDDEVFERSLHQIKYTHIPETTTFPLSEIEVVKLDLKKKGNKIGYIMGAGDDIPVALSQIGYEVDLLDESALNQNLSEYQAILIGGRAYNTKDWLPFYHDKLMAYVYNGGNLICQYQTRGGFNRFRNKMGPYNFEIGRDRVSQEDAAVLFLNPGNQILNSPNKINSEDFEGWVQERGLYFASEWAKEYNSVFSMNDVGEDEKLGSLIYTNYGKGNYVYTGISFFRELPAGVPGAYRLLANLISMK